MDTPAVAVDSCTLAAQHRSRLAAGDRLASSGACWSEQIVPAPSHPHGPLPYGCWEIGALIHRAQALRVYLGPESGRVRIERQERDPAELLEPSPPLRRRFDGVLMRWMGKE